MSRLALRFFSWTLSFLTVAFWAAPAAAHALWVTPEPRDLQDGYKDPPRGPGTGAPCGIGRMVPPQPETPYVAGQPLHVEWSETVTHPGCFVVDFAASNDTGFVRLGAVSHASAIGDVPRPWSLDVTLPSETCATCTLRVRQLMLGSDLAAGDCPPATIPTGVTYYSCANVILTASDGGIPTGGNGGGTGQTGSPGGGCQVGGSGRPVGLAATFLGLLALARARRRKHPRG